MEKGVFLSSIVLSCQALRGISQLIERGKRPPSNFPHLTEETPHCVRVDDMGSFGWSWRRGLFPPPILETPRRFTPRSDTFWNEGFAPFPTFPQRQKKSSTLSCRAKQGISAFYVFGYSFRKSTCTLKISLKLIFENFGKHF